MPLDLRNTAAVLSLLATALLTGCATTKQNAMVEVSHSKTTPATVQPLHAITELPQITEPVTNAPTPAVTLAAFEQSTTGQLPPLPNVQSATKPQPAELLPLAANANASATSTNENTFLLDLPTALRLAEADNLQVGIARLQVDQALARQQRAESLWLPSLRAGLNYNRHEGAIQDVVGNQFNTSRGAFYTGAGAGVFGAGAPMVPGVLAQFHLTDALFQPLAARQAVGARSHAATAVRHNTLLQVSLAHQELQRAAQDLAIAQNTVQQATELGRLTAEFAKVGQGAAADADRAAAERAQRQLDVLRAEETLQVNSARLAQLLRLDASVQLVPAEPQVVPLDLVAVETPIRELTALGLSQRPELAEQRHLVCEAVARLRREQCAPLIPSVMLGASYGGLGSGVNGDLAGMQDRLDVDALAFWELRNFGQGDQAARREAYAVLRQQQLRQLDALDQVAREVVEAHAQLQARAKALVPAEQGWRSAESSQQRNWERIRAGQALPIEVLQSIVALNTAQRSYLRSIIDYNQAQFTLYRALGYPDSLLIAKQ